MTNQSKQEILNIFGVGVAKDKLDIHCLMTGKHSQIENNAASIRLWLNNISKTNITMLTVEKTGGYEELIRSLCVIHNVLVHVAHPLNQLILNEKVRGTLRKIS